MSELYDAISDALVGIGAEPPNNEHDSFRFRRMVPGKTLVVNNQVIQQEPQEQFIDIIPVGAGAEILPDGTEQELQAFRIGSTDFYFDSLDDFLATIGRLRL